MEFYTHFTKIGEKILLRGYNNGERVSKSINYQPYLFIPSNEKSEFVTINNEYVKKMDFDSIYDARDFVKRYKDVQNFAIHGLTEFEYVYINDTYHGNISYDPQLIRVVPIDIEVASDAGFPDIGLADKPITAISFLLNNKIEVFGCGDYVAHQKNITYFKCKDERQLMLKFVERFAKLDCDVITGWNVETFDIPYIINRIKYLFGAQAYSIYKHLSPWKKVNQRTFENKHGTQETYEIVGISTLDYLPLYRKFSYKEQESYKLDHIAHTELGKRKVDYSDYESLLELYHKNFQLFIEYNVRDITLIPELEEEKRFLEQAYGLAFDAKVNFNDALTTVRMWDVKIHNFLMDQKIVVPPRKNTNELPNIPGGYVKDPVPGKYKWVVSFDYTSLYPMLIQHYNISPDTFAGTVEYIGPEVAVNGGYRQYSEMLVEKNVSITPNGCLFSRNKQGFLAALMNKTFAQRKQFKDQMLEVKREREHYEKTTEDGKKLKKQTLKEFKTKINQLDTLQYSKKIQLNSVYGALANKYFRWYSEQQAEAITSSGQLAIRWAADKTNKWFNEIFKTENFDYVIACDTDSMYLSMEPFVDQMVNQGMVEADDTAKIVMLLDKISSTKIEPFLAKQFDQLAQYANAFQQKLHMKRECIGDTAVWVAKKRYIMNVWNEEGVQYTEPKTKITGIEAVRSSTPGVCRDNIKKALKIILNSDNDDLIKFIEQFRSEFEQMPFEDVAFPRGVHSLDQYKSNLGIYRKGTPIHVRGSLVYNDMVKKYNLQNIYQPIYEGDKIKFCYMIKPNPSHENVFAVPSMLPKQFKLAEFIDYQTQFEKSFLDPIKNITNVIGWELEKIAHIEAEYEDEDEIQEFIE